jgi:uncharacterized SAM-binding protein YcdF (DUF218 family)
MKSYFSRQATVTWRGTCIALSLIVAWSLLAWLAADALIVRAELPCADALVVLSGSGTYVERTHRAAELYREGRAPLIILTNDNQQGGWSSEQQRNPLFIERAAEELRREAVPAERIEMLPATQAVSSTYDEGVQLRQYAAEHGLQSILVVTSAYHSRRSLWTLRRIFRGSGIQIGLDPVPPGQQTPTPARWWWQWHGWNMVAGEYLKLIYYWLYYK